MRIFIGIWPPSKPMRAPWWPGRAFWPLTPLPDVLPLPEPRPRPSRFLSRVAPGFGWRLCSEIVDMSEIPRRLGNLARKLVLGNYQDGERLLVTSPVLGLRPLRTGSDNLP